MSRLAPALLAWYDRARRDLAWRRDPSPWKTLVSEFMLQQTVVATVEPYFARFLARFPDARALAAAREEEVTALWSGLGYYARARNLHRAAKAVVERHGGELPPSEVALRELPGVGPYTAAAVAAIAFGARTFALDGNAARVMARLHGVREAVEAPATRARLRALGEADVPAARAGDFAQAVMELGATVCGARAPRCDACPVSALCRAHAGGDAAALPVRAPKRARRVVAVACACVERGGRVLLVRAASGLLAGTWTLPAAEVGPGGREEAARAAARAAGVVPARLAYRGDVRHIFTHRDMTAAVFHATPAAGRAGEGAEREDGAGVARRWVAPAELGELGVSSFTRKTLRLALGAPEPGAASPRARAPRKRGTPAKQDKPAVRP